MVGKNFIDDYFSPDRRLIQGDQHGRAFSESFNSRFPTSGEDLGGLAFAQPAAFYGQTNIQNTDGNGLWRTLNLGGNRLAFNIPSFYSYNGTPTTNGTRRYLLNQETGDVEPFEVEVKLPTRYEEFRVLAVVAPPTIAGEPGEVTPQTTIYEYMDLEECGYPNYAINDAAPRSTGYTGIGGHELPNNYVEGDTVTSERFEYGNGSVESRYFKRILNMQYPDLSAELGWGYTLDENENAEYLQRTGKIRSADGYDDLYAALVISSSDKTWAYGGGGTEYPPFYKQQYSETTALRIVWQGVETIIPLGEYRQSTNDDNTEVEGTSVFPLSLNIFDADVEGIGGSPTITFCYQEWAEFAEDDAVVYAVTSYPFETHYVHRKKNEGESNGRRYLEFTENDESRSYYIGDDSELVLTEIGGKNDNA